MEKIIRIRRVQDICLRNIFKCVVPAYLTTLFNTLYTIADGMFVSKYAGTNALAAINTVYPIVNILTGIALVFAAGGSAAAALHIGAAEAEQADRAFSVSMLFSILTGCMFSFIVFLGLKPILLFMGATSATMNDCRIYALIWIVGTPAAIGKELFTYFIRADGSAAYSFFTALSGGLLNIILDYFFVGWLRMGIWGAGLATVLGLEASFAIGIMYFVKWKKHLYFTIHGLRLRTGLYCMINGASEFIDQLAAAVVTVACNRSALALAGEDGIAAVSIIMYLQFIFTGVCFGYSAGLSPYLSYAYGEKKAEICRKLEQYSYCFVMAAPLILYILDYTAAPACILLFAEEHSSVYALAVTGMRLYGLGFSFSGINTFTAICLTSYGKGYYSGLITFIRSFVFMLPFLTLLSPVYGMDGIWLSYPAAEILTAVLSAGIYFKLRKGGI